jgi:ABC-type spermidine/putrescine transport system permease subunit I
LKVIIPAAMPSILAGLQLGMGVTIILIVAAEMIGGARRFCKMAQTRSEFGNRLNGLAQAHRRNGPEPPSHALMACD